MAEIRQLVRQFKYLGISADGWWPTAELGGHYAAAIMSRPVPPVAVVFVKLWSTLVNASNSAILRGVDTNRRINGIADQLVFKVGSDRSTAGVDSRVTTRRERSLSHINDENNENSCESILRPV